MRPKGVNPWVSMGGRWFAAPDCARYNLVRPHRALGTTPAVAAGIESRLWALSEIVALTGW